MSKQNATWLLPAAIFLVLAGLGIWIGIARGGSVAAESHDHGHGHSHGEDGSHGHDHGGATAPKGPVKLSPQALKNLGVKVAEIDTQEFFKHQDVPAVVVELPASSQPVYAPLGGRILEVKVQPGTLVASGDVLVRIVRDGIPRPQLAVIGDVLKPSNEEYHSTISEARKAARNVSIIKTEIDRIKQYAESGTQDGLSILPKKNLIDLRYELARAEQDLSNVRAELARHGLSDSQIAGIESGEQIIIAGPEFWKKTLERNNLWPPLAEKTFAALPKDVQEMPWTVAVVAELSASGIASETLADWFQKTPAAGKQFHEIAGLLQQGQTVSAIKGLYESSALNQIIELKAPRDGAPDWDVHELFIKPGEKVEAGAKLLTLDNPRHVLLKTAPVGGETPHILNALKQDADLEAVPLVTGSGPDLKGLKIEFLASEEKSHGTVAYVRAPNEALHVRDRGAQGKFRSWSLREGQRYVLRIPTEKFSDAFVLPLNAIAEMGPDKIVFIQNGDGFKAVKVVILYQDSEKVVLDSKTSELFPGDPVVQQGAFGLGLALNIGAGEQVDCCGEPVKK